MKFCTRSPPIPPNICRKFKQAATGKVKPIMVSKDEACSCRAHSESRVNFSWAVETASKINTGTKITNLSYLLCVKAVFSLAQCTEVKLLGSLVSFAAACPL